MKNKTHQNFLIAWLGDPKAAKFLGRAAALKIEIMAMLAGSGDTLPAIAARHGVSRQAVDRHHQRARKIFFGEQQNLAPVDLNRMAEHQI
jgi:hypothetical protein